MKLVILFWFYKDIEVCKNRLELLQQYNPDMPIYGLYGGEQDQEAQFKEALEPYLDDFYTSTTTDAYKKWIDGDLELLQWYTHRGKDLEWDTFVMVQWDLLCFTPLTTLFSDLEQDQNYFCHYEQLTPEEEEKWTWTSSEYEKRCTREQRKEYLRSSYLKYLNHIKEKYKYTDRAYRTVFMFAALCRSFMESYVKEEKMAFLEYTLPTYSKIYGIDIFEMNLGEKDGDEPMNADDKEITKEYIHKELEKPNGWRVFHPCYQIWEEST